MHVYLGSPDFLRVDQGTLFISKEFKPAAAVDGIGIEQEPIENPALMSHVERYHAPQRIAFERISKDLPDERPHDVLQMALHCVSSTVGPEGLCPTLCVFGAIPRPARHTASPTQLARAAAIDVALEAVSKERANVKRLWA